MTTKDEMDKLKEVVNEIFNVDIIKKSNKRDFVNARKVFSKMLIERGFGSSEIGRYIRKHHSTIIHYRYDVDAMLKYSPTVMEKYLACKSAFSNKEQHIQLNPKELEQKRYIISLNNQIEKLILDRNAILKKADKHRRILTITELVDKRTPIGEEAFVLKKINQMFNGISKYEQELD